LDLSGNILVFSSLLIFISPLILMAFIWAAIKQAKELRYLLIWSAILFFYYEWGTINIRPWFYVPINPFNEARNFLFVMAPLVVVLSIYINRLLNGKLKRSYLALVALIGFSFAINYEETIMAGLIP